MPAKRKMKLGFIMEGPGNGYADWRHPDADPAAMVDFQWFAHHAQEAERGKFDFVFYADVMGYTEKLPPRTLSRLEPFTLLAGLSVVTEKIGLAATVSSTFTAPYNCARMFASLDHMSKGRAGWNLVTSSGDAVARNFGMTMPSHDERYKMADDHLAAVRALWDSWEDEALVFNKETGQFFDPSKVHAANHKGPYYEVSGPMNLWRCPQGQPIVFQAGASEDGKAFAAKNADAIFTSVESVEAGKAFRDDVRARATGFGRNPDHILILPPIMPYVGRTDEEAQFLFEERAKYIDLKVQLTFLSKYYFGGYDFTKHDPDAPFPDVLRPEHLEGLQASIMRFMKRVKDNNMTLREAAASVGPKNNFVGTPQKVADAMEVWFNGGVCDGFILNESSPNHLTAIVDLLVPELQRRGLARTEYEGSTFRDHLGLPKPENRYTAARRNEAVA